MSSEADRAPKALASLAVAYARPDAERWNPVPEALDRAIASDTALAAAAADARRELASTIASRLVGVIDRRYVARFATAMLDAPRERFVLPEDIAISAEDMPTPLDREGLATVSAPHAYVLTYALLGLGEGDHLIEMGTGTGYGAAIASRVVGPKGRVSSIEIDPVLHERAQRILADRTARGPAWVELMLGDAGDLAARVLEASAAFHRPVRVAVTYALAEPPDELLERLPEGGRFVAPIGDEDQRLIRWMRESGALVRASFGAVRYVAERG